MSSFELSAGDKRLLERAQVLRIERRTKKVEEVIWTNLTDVKGLVYRFLKDFNCPATAARQIIRKIPLSHSVAVNERPLWLHRGNALFAVLLAVVVSGIGTAVTVVDHLSEGRGGGT